MFRWKNVLLHSSLRYSLRGICLFLLTLACWCYECVHWKHSEGKSPFSLKPTITLKANHFVWRYLIHIFVVFLRTPDGSLGERICRSTYVNQGHVSALALSSGSTSTGASTTLEQGARRRPRGIWRRTLDDDDAVMPSTGKRY